MRVMKDSGIAWIGEIPENWKMVQVRYLFRIGRGRVISQTELQDNGIYPVFSSQTKDNGCLGYINTYDFDISQLTWTTDGANAGTVFLRSGKHNCTNVCGTLQPLNAEIDLRFQKYALEHIAYYHKRADTNGFKIMNNEMANIYTILPPLNTQRRIADYLDRKCSQIDAIIARQQEVIEKLKAYKLSVITEAVTKGLNPHAPMKDSGVEWIGEIPADWEVSKLKFMGHFVNGYAFSSNSFTTDGVRVMKIANIQPMRISWIDASYVDTSEYNRLSMYRVEQGDLVFALTRPIINGGIKVAIFDGKDKVLLNQRNAMFKGLSRVLSRWMYYVMQNQMYVQEFALYIDATGQQPNISTNEISQIKIPIPPIEVQQEIIMKLDAIMASIEKLISRKEQVIQRLSDYKKSLIYDVVTGKKEV